MTCSMHFIEVSVWSDALMQNINTSHTHMWCDVVEAHATVANLFYQGNLSTSRSNDKRRLIVGRERELLSWFLHVKYVFSSG